MDLDSQGWQFRPVCIPERLPVHLDSSPLHPDSIYHQPQLSKWICMKSQPLYVCVPGPPARNAAAIQ